MRLPPWAAAAAVLLAISPLGQLNAQWLEQIDGQLQEIRELVEKDGYRPLEENRTGSLKNGARETQTLTLRAGIEYMVVGVCDTDCKDLDLRLRGPAGDEMDVDVETDDTPIVSVTPSVAGNFSLEVVMVSCSTEPCYWGVGIYGKGGVAVAESVGTEDSRLHRGELTKDDDTLNSGEFTDRYNFQGKKGERVILDLRSTEFDPYLILISPSGSQEENDDHEGDATRSLLSVALAEDGEYSVIATSYAPEATGSYDLRIDRGWGEEAGAGPRTERGTLAAGDDTLRSGEFTDPFDFQARPGQRVHLDLTSNDFDTYLILKLPNGEQLENDDDDRAGHSVIDANITEPGDYQVLVTSFETGETGSYDLVIELEDAGTSPGVTRDLVPLALGQSTSGSLGEGDGRLEAGEYRDLYVFDGTAGETIVVEMDSPEFDTYLGLMVPGGDDVQNDDHEGSTSHSLIEMTLEDSGRYRIIATSYAEGETGRYDISLRRGSAPPPSRPGERPPTPGAGRVFGVFAGVSDYGGRAGDLAYTAEDATRMQQALIRGAGMRPQDAVLLRNQTATLGNLHGAVRELAPRMGPDDTFVLFFSGHGDRVPRDAPQPTDPDALDETLEFYDDAITDDELRELLGEVGAGTVLVFLDACFSGGFSKDIISVPGRMGLFSSEEDVTSSVAAKFRAGGYLALFLADGIGDGLADGDGDGEITTLELSQYVHERYRTDVKSGGAGDYVRTGGPELGYQHLVVDRGSLGPSRVLFR